MCLGNCVQFEKPGLYKPYLIMDCFDPILILEFRSQEVMMHTDVTINDKESK